MASMFDRLRAALKRPGSPSADLERAVGAAAEVLTKAEARLEELRSRRRDVLTSDDGARSSHRLAVREAEDDVADAREYLAALGERHAAALRAEVEAARQGRLDATKAQRDAAAKALTTTYPRLAGEMVALLREVMEAEAVVLAVNAEQPEGAPRLMGVEALVRDWPSLLRQELPSQDRKAWVFAADGSEVPPGRLADIYASSGKHYFPTASGPAREVVQATIRERRALPDEGARQGPRLADLQLPGLRYGDPALHDGTTGDPKAVLAQLDALAAARPAIRAERKVETRSEIIEQPAAAEAGSKAA